MGLHNWGFKLVSYRCPRATLRRSLQETPILLEEHVVAPAPPRPLLTLNQRVESCVYRAFAVIISSSAAAPILKREGLWSDEDVSFCGIPHAVAVRLQQLQQSRVCRVLVAS